MKATSVRHIGVVTALLILSAVSLSAKVSVTLTGGSHQVISDIPEKQTGLDRLFVVYDITAITEMQITGYTGSVTVEKYGNMGGGYAEPVAGRYDGNAYIVDTPAGDMGYIIHDDNDFTYVWIVNYADHKFEISSIEAAAAQDCDNTTLNVVCEAAPIHYYTIDGRPCELSREIELTYDNLKWDSDTKMYMTEAKSKILPSISHSVVITPPLYCSSHFYITGDRFLTTWGTPQHCESGVISPNGLAVQTFAVQTNADDFDTEVGGSSGDEEDGTDAVDRPGSNVIKTETEGLGGSAPAVIEFTAYTTDAVIHEEWQIARDENFSDILYRFDGRTVEHTFDEEGNYYARFIGSNSDGSCDTYGETFTISIGASDLRIPNAFSPNDDGVNDIWKVGYRSLLKFKCSIFDRYGNELYHFEDPSDGWDGKVRGKTVKPGVYFYVIEAEGADGKKYKKGGDINVVGYRKIGSNVATD